MWLIPFDQHCRRSQIWKKLAVGLSVFLGVYFILISEESGAKIRAQQKVILSKKREQMSTMYQYGSQAQGEEEYEGYEDANPSNGARPGSSHMNYSVRGEAGEYYEGGPFYDTMHTDFPPPKHPHFPPAPPPGPVKMNRNSKTEKAEKEAVAVRGKKTSSLKLDKKRFNSEQLVRKTLLREQCKKLNSHKVSKQSDHTISHMMLMDQKHKLLFCYIPKVGCTFFKRLMMVLNNKIPNTVDPYSISANRVHILRMDYLPVAPKRRNEVLQGYRKMMFVRDPYVRLFSGYLDKMFMARPSIFKLSSYIIKTFRPGSTSAEWKCPIDVSFEELIRYVIHSHTKNTHSNYHFQPMHTLCNVCGLEYDVIGKLETFTNDVYFAMDKINQTSRLPKGDFRLVRMEDELRTVVNYAFQMKRNTCMTFGQRLRRLWRRAQIRGFLSLDLKFPLTDDEAMTITHQAFVNLIKDAQFKSHEDPMLQTNKLDAMIQLYNKVPMDLLDKLQKLFETDCTLFGYDPKPDIVFRRELLRSSPFNYFDLIKVR